MRAHRRLRHAVLGSVVLAAAGVGGAKADTAKSFAVDRFEPSERGSEWFALDTLDLRGEARPAIGIVGDWGYRPLAIYNPDGSIRTALVDNQIVAHIGASMVLLDRIRIGLDLPVQLYANGNGGTIDGTTYAPPSNAQSIGDLRVSGDLRLFGVYGDVITGAIGASLWVPTGSRDNYASDGSVRADGHATIAGDVGVFAYSARVAGMYRAGDQEFASSPVGSEFQFGGAAGVRVLDRKLLVGPEVFGATVIGGGTTSAVFKSHTTPLEGLIGAHYTIGRNWRVGGGVGAGITKGYGTPVARGLLSLEWTPGIAPPVVVPPPPADRDHDGIIDVEDACPDVPGIRTNDPKTNGCPSDRDGDGIYDTVDACPDIPGKPSDDPKKNGCPTDRDGDGIYDKDDACPDIPGIKTDNPKTNGCPSDRDGDGILDKDDACPDVPGKADPDPKKNGCPDPDRDKDGIPNEVDACPDDYGKPDKDPKKNGCPKAYVKADRIVITDQVQFATASAKILEGKTSVDVLRAVLDVLQKHPEIKHVRIEGHTDSRGSAEFNQKLSTDRAASVMKWLVQHGVDKGILTSQGFGKDRPIDTNDTEPGRQNNRRVEFHIEGGAK